jgi:hypothetical protein
MISNKVYEDHLHNDRYNEAADIDDCRNLLPTIRHVISLFIHFPKTIHIKLIKLMLIMSGNLPKL